MRHGRFISLMIAAISSVLAPARMYEQPRSFALNDDPLHKVERRVVPRMNPGVASEEGRDPQRPAPYRIAVAADVRFTPDNSGTWQTLPDGRLWRLRIYTEGAKSLSLGINSFEMPDQAKLWIYGPDRKHVQGPYSSRNRSRQGSLWTPVIEGEEVVVEVFVPVGAPAPGLVIGKVNQGFRGL